MLCSLAEVYRRFRGSDVVGLSKVSVQFYQTTWRHIRCNNNMITKANTNRYPDNRDVRRFI